MSDSTIEDLETQLKAAMLISDIPLLDELLADDLIFTNHLGQVMSKQDDLEAHRSGFVRIESIDQSEQVIQSGDTMAVVTVLARIKGTFGGIFSETALRFTRVWKKTGSQTWQVIVAHSTLVAGI